MPAPGACRYPRLGVHRRCLRNRHPRRESGFSSFAVSAKPRAMNRTGLIVALALAAVIGLLFGIYPELDLKLASLFYDEASRAFPRNLNALAAIARDGAMVIAWVFALPAIVAL